MDIFDSLYNDKRPSIQYDFAANDLEDGSTNSVPEIKKESSSEASSRRRATLREIKSDEDLQGELDAFLEAQKKADEDGDFSKEEEKEATDLFVENAYGRKKNATQGDIEDLEIKIPNELEANHRLAPKDPIHGDIMWFDTDGWVKLDLDPQGALLLAGAGGVEWLPFGAEGEQLVGGSVEPEWKEFIHKSPSTNDMLYWNGTKYNTVSPQANNDLLWVNASGVPTFTDLDEALGGLGATSGVVTWDGSSFSVNNAYETWLDGASGWADGGFGYIVP